MSNQGIAQIIKQFITTNFYLVDPASLNPKASFYEQGVIDSTGVLEVVSFLEETFGITIQDHEMLPENLDSLQALNNFVERKLSVVPHLRLLTKEDGAPASPSVAPAQPLAPPGGERDPAA